MAGASYENGLTHLMTAHPPGSTAKSGMKVLDQVFPPEHSF